MNKKKVRHNKVEKTVFGFGLIVIVALTGYLIFQIFNDSKTPPQLVLKSEIIGKHPDLTYRIEIENRGEETAEAVSIRFGLYEGAQVVETATLNIDYVPSRSTETGFINFGKRSKLADSLKVSSISFLKP